MQFDGPLLDVGDTIDEIVREFYRNLADRQRLSD